MQHERESRRVWFITGASRGFGAEIATAALAAGDLVVATARNTKPVVERLGERSDLLALSVDVTDEPSMASAVRDAVSRFGRIDVLVLPLGTDAVDAIEAKNAFVTRELEAWRQVSTSTDFPPTPV